MKTDIDSQADQSDQMDFMRRYLLGALAEAEQIALEQKFFADGEVLDRVWAVENDLVDEFVRGQLSPAERDQFEQNYLASPVHRERVAFAQTLLPQTPVLPPHPAALVESAEAVPARSPASTESFWAKILVLFRTPQFAAAAMVVAVMLFGGIWWMQQRARYQQQIARMQAQYSADEQRARELESQIAGQRERNSQLSTELERLRAERRRAAEAPSTTAASSTVFSFLLLPSVRAGSEQQILQPPPFAKQVRLQMQIERRDYRRFRASVRAVDGGERWPASSVKAAGNKDGALVSALVPAAKLKRGDYILTLTGIDAAGTAEEIDRYFFRVGGK